MKEKNNKKVNFLVLCIPPLIFIYEEMVFLLVKNADSLKFNIFSVLLSMFFGLLLDVILLIFNKKAKTILIVVTIITAIIYMLESFLYRIFNTYYNLSTVQSMTTNVVGDYKNDIMTLVSQNYLIVLLYILPLIFLIVFSNNNDFDEKLFNIKINIGKVFNINCRNVLTVFTVLFLFLNMFVIYINKNSLLSEYSFSNITYKYGLNTGIVIDILSNLKNSQYDMNANIEENNNKIDDASDNILNIDFETINKKYPTNEMLKKMNTYVSSITPSNKNKYTGLFKGKNLILICAESFYSHAVNEKITPTLYRLMNNGFKFTNFYNALSNISTSNGEFQFLFGLVPIGGKSMSNVVNHNNYFTIANQMKRIGYHTAAFHNGNHYYYNRDITHESIGYEYYMAMGNGLEKLTLNNTDFELFDKTFDLYKDKQPFSTYYMTYDCHMPYHIPFPRYRDNIAKVNKYLGENIEAEEKMYYAKLICFDDALTNLIAKLEKEGILDDTVICITADHYPYGLEQYGKRCLYDICGYQYGDNELNKRDRNSMVLWNTMLEKDTFELEKEVNTPSYSIDILPTLSNLFGLDFDSRFMIGRDVFSDKEPLVIWDNYSFLDKDMFYNSLTGEVITNDKKAVDKEVLEQKKKDVKNKVMFSKDVISIDYFDYLFENNETIDSSAGKSEATKSEITEQEKVKIKNTKNIEKGKEYENVLVLIDDYANAKSVVDVGIKDSIDEYDTVKIGNYEQDGNLENGNEAIEWIILHKFDKAVMLLSKDILDAKQYNERALGVSWDEVSIRKFLNEEFYNNAFSDNEKIVIFNMAHRIGEKEYTDYVYLPTAEELKVFFNINVHSNENKIIAAKGTKYAIDNGLFVKNADEKWYDGNSLYWLATDKPEYNHAPLVEYSGFISTYGAAVNTINYGIRPMICVYWQ